MIDQIDISHSLDLVERTLATFDSQVILPTDPNSVIWQSELLKMFVFSLLWHHI